ncbi:PorT family protein [Antarcticibacterium arcticum]|uniref:PorT family protein n=1 Tax=Antarcticibacterium arcticum TaxID=2585771 RepID=A0A5B8YNL6_9FLAO|nr:outer membrane beta-barrel protein [Antarcticibacterium arcticum]QED37856.1 PorT family protein [Antarcticibacterium arcticum]
MKENIDQLYNRKLKGVETPPPDDVWKNISSRLPQKETKKRAFPLWYKVGGVAAALALLFFIGNDVFTTSGNPDVQIVWEADPSAEIKKDLLPSDFSNNQISGTSKLLESLIIKNNNNSGSKVPSENKPAVNSKSGDAYFKELEEAPEFSLTPTSTYTFFEHNNVAFQEEMQEQQHLQQIIEEEIKTGNLATVQNEIDQPEDETVKNPKMLKRLSITPTAGAVYLDNMGSGNFIDNGFENNKSSGEVSMAYGVQLAYQLTDKIKIRSGVNKVDLSYNTRDINYSSALNAVALGGSGTLDNSAGMALSIAAPMAGNLNQRMGFIEIPLEFELALSDKKLGLNIIAGGSTLFLDNNMVSLNSPEFSTDLGQAQNLNSISYSANIGLGVNYSLSSRLLWNLEPVFKYQLNTFNNTAGVNPYYLGLYSGFSFKF